MAGNSFGTLFRYTTWGESHGPAIGCVVDGVPPLLPLAEPDLQHWLDRRRPGQSKFTTQRREPDQAKILSGTFEGLTTGAPIAVLIENVDARTRDYGAIKDQFRPGHADFTYQAKYGIRDYRGGGRASARETAMRVAAGAIARKVLGEGVTIKGALIQVGDDRIDRARWNWNEIDRNPFWCPDAEAAARWEALLLEVRKRGSSLGAVIEVVASGVPAGLGEPAYDKLDADLAKAMMSINAVKGVEIGAGFQAATLSGEDNADEIRIGNDGQPLFLSNNAGGVLGGISTGQDVVVRFAVKPTSSILTPRRSIDRFGQEVEVVHQGSPRSLRRHPRGAGRRGDDGGGPRRPSAAPSGPRELRPRAWLGSAALSVIEQRGCRHPSLRIVGSAPQVLGGTDDACADLVLLTIALVCDVQEVRSGDPAEFLVAGFAIVALVVHDLLRTTGWRAGLSRARSAGAALGAEVALRPLVERGGAERIADRLARACGAQQPEIADLRAARLPVLDVAGGVRLAERIDAGELVEHGAYRCHLATVPGRVPVVVVAPPVPAGVRIQERPMRLRIEHDQVVGVRPAVVAGLGPEAVADQRVRLLAAVKRDVDPTGRALRAG